MGLTFGRGLVLERVEHLAERDETRHERARGRREVALAIELDLPAGVDESGHQIFHRNADLVAVRATDDLLFGHLFLRQVTPLALAGAGAGEQLIERFVGHRIHQDGAFAAEGEHRGLHVVVPSSL
ncbi:MAG: hypothetical protein RLZZ360_158 [Candidatus Parcubacteria bacterium]